MSTNSNEYQHFIPQFILKNYAYPFTCPKCNDAGRGKRKGCKCKHTKGKYPGDLVINTIDLSKTPFEQEVRPVKRTFGVPGMYHDPSRMVTREHRRIEDMFGKMESQASHIFQRIVKGHTNGDTAVMLTRIERDLLRKFLFLLKYRGSGYHRRFNHEATEDYYANDRTRLLPYMEKHGFATPRDVWFHNLETIMNLKMDAKLEWIQSLPKDMYPDDASGFIAHVQSSYMAICTPTDPEMEFILTENCYNVFEGRSECLTDNFSKKAPSGAFAPFHEFAPISPRLMIVLRCFALPNPEKDQNPVIQEQRESFYWLSCEQTFGMRCRSLLADLPIRKATNSYTSIIDGNIVPDAGHDGSYRPNDRFWFRFHSIKSAHVGVINSIFLDNAPRLQTLAFRNQDSLFKLLDDFVGGPCDNWKMVEHEDSLGRLVFLRNLETLARSKGSKQQLVWKRMPPINVIASDQAMERALAFRSQMDLCMDPEQLDEASPVQRFLGLYNKLGKDRIFHNDIAQAGKMVYFGSFVSVCSGRHGTHVQSRAQTFISKMFLASANARYWLYLKLYRKSQIGQNASQDLVDLFVDEAVRDGPEDMLANVSSLLDPGVLNELMRLAVDNQIMLQMQGIQDIWTEASKGQRFDHVRLTLLMIKFRCGSICNCGKLLGVSFIVLPKSRGIIHEVSPGIPSIEAYAKSQRHQQCDNGANDVFTALADGDEELGIELMTRVRVRMDFANIFGDVVDQKSVEDLKGVLFSLTFPTPPRSL